MGLGATLVDLWATLVDLWATLVDLWATLVDLWATLVDLWAVGCGWGQSSAWCTSSSTWQGWHQAADRVLHGYTEGWLLTHRTPTHTHRNPCAVTTVMTCKHCGILPNPQCH